MVLLLGGLRSNLGEAAIIGLGSTSFCLAPRDFSYSGILCLILYLYFTHSLSPCNIVPFYPISAPSRNLVQACDNRFLTT